MNSLPSDVSLYELALETDPAPAVLQASPATFKSVFSAFIDLLIERELPAVMWVKLPRGGLWQADLERYRTLTGVPRAIYIFKNHREDGAEDAGSKTAAVGTDGEPLATSTAEATFPLVNLVLAPESQLRREYFLVIWSTQFRSALLAHRPRSAQGIKPTTATPDTGSNLTDVGTIGATDDTTDRRQQLLVLSAFEDELIQRLLTGLEQAAMLSPETASLVADASPPTATIPLSDAVAQWQTIIATMPNSSAELPLLGQLFVKQLQRQEEIWQRGAIYRRQAETAETLQLQNEDLSSALRSKDDFINTVGQELRTPLTTIKTALSLLNSPNLKPPQRQRYMDLIAKECDRQSSLITSLIDLVQLDQMVDQADLQPIRVAEIVPGVVSTYQPLAEEKGVRLAYTVPEDLPPIACVGNWLKQIVINLLHNGIKFTPQGGQVWVRARQQGDFVNLEVRDTGVGLAPGEIPKIFDRFYRVRQASSEDISGAGLGLTIVQQLVIHCGGSISVKSRLGEGTTFNVLLPVHRPADSSS